MVDSTIQIFWWLIVDGSAVEQHSSEGLWLVAVDGGQHNSESLMADCRW